MASQKDIAALLASQGGQFSPIRKRGYLLPIGKDGKGKTRPAVPQFIYDIAEAMMAPGKVLKDPGLMIDPETGRTSDYAIERSADLAGILTLGAGAIPAEANTLRMGAKKPPITRSTGLTDIRPLPRDEAIRIARQEPHLIPAPDGGYVGGPDNIRNRKDLLRQRRSIDAQIERGAPGADWYDRIRAGIDDVTGGIPNARIVMANEHGMFSAGVSPESELGYATKTINSNIATGGNPVKAARPAQQQAAARAAQQQDPNAFMLGKKTGEYAKKINPDMADKVQGATGVNDFRHARELGFTEPDGSPRKGALGPAAHRYSDYETALATDRASKRQLGGFDEWTGEMAQAAPWVAQKADDLLKSRQKFYMKRAEGMVGKGSNRPPEEIAWELAFDDAKKTAADFFPKHTANATYESLPYSEAGHLSGLLRAPKFEQDAFALDPRNAWNTAPGGRDAIYGGMAAGPVEGGFGMRVRPTVPAQGVWDGPQGTEYNQAFVARPLVGFDTGKRGKALPQADRDILTAGEATRAYMDVQGAGAAHKTFTGGKTVADSPSVYLRKQQPGQLPPEELARLRSVGGEYGLPHAIDTGEGVTLTNFDETPRGLAAKQRAQRDASLNDSGLYNKGYDVSVDGVYKSYGDEWAGPQGSGAATRSLLQTLDTVQPGVRDALDRNPYLAGVAQNKIDLIDEASKKYGAARKDVINALKIVGEGPGWVGRLREALDRGVILPAAAAALLAPAMYPQQQGDREQY
jgi:hypothetical protein